MQTLNGMKHTLLIMAGIFTLIAYTSCKKDYACQCVHKYYTADTINSIITANTEKRAEAACESGNGVSATMYDCNLNGKSEIIKNK